MQTDEQWDFKETEIRKRFHWPLDKEDNQHPCGIRVLFTEVYNIMTDDYTEWRAMLMPTLGLGCGSSPNSSQIKGML